MNKLRDFSATQASVRIPGHMGTLAIQNTKIFGEPSQAIGQIISAGSTLPINAKPTKTTTRVILSSILACLLAGVTFFIVTSLQSSSVVVWVSTSFAGMIGMVAGWFALTTYYSSYVGELGLAQFACRGTNPGDARLRQLMYFEDARCVRTSQTKCFMNNVYSGTQFKYQWFDRSDNELFRIDGVVNAEHGNPAAQLERQQTQCEFGFALAAKKRWNEYLLARLIADIDSNGFASFKIASQGEVSVGYDWIEIEFKGKKERWSADEFESIDIEQGVLTLTHKDSQTGWFSSSGIFAFNFAEIDNADVFFILVSTFFGR